MLMPEYENLILDVADHIATITLNRPPVNALSMGLYRDIVEAFNDVNDMPDVRVAILTGRGRCFCAGRDLKSAENEDPKARAKLVKAGLGAIYHCEVPVIAAVNGPAMGAGFCCAALCDFVIASEEALFAMPEIDAAVNPSVATILRVFNQHQARGIAFTGERYTPDDMHRMGMVRKVVPAGDLIPTATELAAALAAKSPLAMRSAKWSANEAEGLLNNFESVYRAVESRISDANMSSNDRREAARAFSEHRPPVFTGS
jgi:enoyl-CoA hydratase